MQLEFLQRKLQLDRLHVLAVPEAAVQALHERRGLQLGLLQRRPLLLQSCEGDAAHLATPVRLHKRRGVVLPPRLAGDLQDVGRQLASVGTPTGLDPQRSVVAQLLVLAQTLSDDVRERARKREET